MIPPAYNVGVAYPGHILLLISNWGPHLQACRLVPIRNHFIYCRHITYVCKQNPKAISCQISYISTDWDSLAKRKRKRHKKNTMSVLIPSQIQSHFIFAGMCVVWIAPCLQHLLYHPNIWQCPHTLANALCHRFHKHAQIGNS